MKRKITGIALATAFFGALISLFNLRADESLGRAVLRWNPIATVALLLLCALAYLWDRKTGAGKDLLLWLRQRGKISVFPTDGKRALFSEWMRLASDFVFAITAIEILLYLMLDLYSIVWMTLIFQSCLLFGILRLVSRFLSANAPTPAELFLTVCLCAGVMMAVIFPIGKVSWDDETHFTRAYNMVYFWRRQFPQVYADLREVKYWGQDFFADTAGTLDRMILAEGQSALYKGVGVDPYMMISYLPMAIAILLTGILQADFLTVWVFARLAVALTYAAIVYCGLKKIRTGGYVLSAVALLPTAIFLSASHSYDSWLTAWMIYGLCSLLSVMQTEGKTFTKATCTEILLAFFLGCSAKAIYIFLALFLLFLPKARFETEKARRRFFACVAGVFLLVIGIMLISNLCFGSFTDDRGGETVSSSGQVLYILQHPFEYAKTLFNFLSFYCSLLEARADVVFFGYIGHPSLHLGNAAVVLTAFAVVTDRSRSENYREAPLLRPAMLVISAATVVLCATSMYVGFTPVGLNTINGCQYRYLLPVYPFFFYSLASCAYPIRLSDRVKSIVVFGGMFSVLFLSAGQVYHDYIAQFIR